VASFMAAKVSTGGEWPSGEGTARRGAVIYITAEDKAADTIRPRLEAAGADLKRVHIIEAVNDHFGRRPFNLVSDLSYLSELLGLGRRIPCGTGLRNTLHENQSWKRAVAGDWVLRFCRSRTVGVYSYAQAGRPEPAGVCACQESRRGRQSPRISDRATTYHGQNPRPIRRIRLSLIL
jgi:hypothetical protein